MTKTSKITSICYHYINKSGPFSRIWGHSQDLFISHLNFFTEHCPPVSLADLRAALNGEKELPPRCSLLTFDDGLKEHGQFFGPYLAERKISALFNVCSSVVTQSLPTISQTLHFGTAVFGVRQMAILLQKYLDNVEIGKTYFNFLEKTKSLPALDLNKKLKNFFNQKFSHQSGLRLMRDFWCGELESRYPDIFNRVFMNQTDLHSLLNDGHEIGLHTATHRMINDELFTKEIYDQEILLAKLDLEKVLNKKIGVFAYPFGHQNGILRSPINLDKLKATGIDFIFTTFSGEKKELDTNFIGRYLTQRDDDVSVLKKKLWFYEVTYNY